MFGGAVEFKVVGQIEGRETRHVWYSRVLYTLHSLVSATVDETTCIYLYTLLYSETDSTRTISKHTIAYNCIIDR